MQINIFIEIVDNQLRMDNPRITKITLNRLMKMGYAEIDSKKLIAIALSKTINNMLLTKTTFDEDEYTKLLNKLPDYK